MRLGGGGATMLGPVAVTNDVTASGKSFKTHTHWCADRQRKYRSAQLMRYRR